MSLLRNILIAAVKRYQRGKFNRGVDALYEKVKNPQTPEEIELAKDLSKISPEMLKGAVNEQMDQPIEDLAAEVEKYKLVLTEECRANDYHEAGACMALVECSSERAVALTYPDDQKIAAKCRYSLQELAEMASQSEGALELIPAIDLGGGMIMLERTWEKYNGK